MLPSDHFLLTFGNHHKPIRLTWQRLLSFTVFCKHTSLSALLKLRDAEHFHSWCWMKEGGAAASSTLIMEKVKPGPLARPHYCYPTTAGRMYSKYYSIKLSLQDFYCLFPLMDHNISVSHREHKKTVDCNCSFAPVSIKMDFQMWASLHFSHFPLRPSHLPSI